jgi:hypothetical protein
MRSNIAPEPGRTREAGERSRDPRAAEVIAFDMA